MVYTQVEIILGVVIMLDDLKKIIMKEVDDNKLIDELMDYCREYGVKEFPRNSQLYDYRCCSKSKGKLFILGYPIHTYYRKKIRCSNCEEYSVCNDCIGQTNNGYYDVEKILDGPNEVNIRNVCLYCYADNKQDLNAPLKTCFVENGIFLKNDYDKSVRIKCSTCNCVQNEHRSPTDFLKFREYRWNILCKFLKRFNINKDVKLYYMLDDCLSCT